MLYGFYDFGYTNRKEADPDTPDAQSLAAAGAGIRFSFTRVVTGYVEIAVPLTREVAQEGNKDARVFGGIQASF
jgi:hemolysin activation/secretion protein